MRLDPNRLVSATAAPTIWPALLAAAIAGRTTHIVDDGRVLAHLVPPDALVLGEPVEHLLLTPAIGAEAARFAAEVEQSGYHHPGTGIAAILAWLWQASTAAALHWLGAYTAELTAALAARALSAPPFDALWAALAPALNGCLIAEEVADFAAAAHARLGSDGPRPHAADDPWPDVTPGGRCFAKKRYRDIAVGDFIPGHAGADLDYDDGWCRVEGLELDDSAGIRVSLRDADGQAVVRAAPEPAMWVPSRSREPWHWGLPG